MPRSKRIQFPGMLAHVFSRGNEKRNIYKNNADRAKFIKLIKQAYGKYDFTIHAYCLMPNHYHFVLESHDGKLAKLMQFINGEYAQWFNWKHKRTGHLFQGRYKSIIVEKDTYATKLIRYVLINPLKAKLVERLSEYKWCSYDEYMGKKGNKITDTSWVLKLFHKNEQTAKRYLKLYLAEEQGIDIKMIEESMVNDLVYGSKEFVENVKSKMTKLGIELPDSCFKSVSKTPDEIIDIVAEKFEVNRTELMTKKGKWNYARRTAIHYVNRFGGCSCTKTAAIFNIHNSRIKRVSDSLLNERKENTSLHKLMLLIETIL